MRVLVEPRRAGAERLHLDVEPLGLTADRAAEQERRVLVLGQPDSDLGEQVVTWLGLEVG